MKKNITTKNLQYSNGKIDSLAIACGGTGGHFYPGLSIARYFKKRGGKVILLLSGKHVAKQRLIAKEHGIEVLICDAPLLTKNLIKVPVFTLKMLRNCLMAKKYLKQHEVDAFLAMGSFASVPWAFAARFLNIPVFVHEGNARLGKANRLICRLARCLAMSYPLANKDTCRCESILTGMPIRPELKECGRHNTKAYAIKELNREFMVHFAVDVPTLLIFGGSLGAKVFNDTIPEVLKSDFFNGEINSANINQKADIIQIIHLTGENHFSATHDAYKQNNFKYLVLPYFEDMQLLYSACDAVFCRSGGSTVSELAFFKKYAFLVPYPFAAENHQHDNALVAQNTEAAQIIHNDNCSAAFIEETLQNWVQNHQQYEFKGQCFSDIGYPDAEERVIKMIEDYCK
ncbi:UDP-N-acetylglucosamine--N-acetylmuramyl-(pentapeptide) pyrophosphoryl-undecaprenol N-acetylglucosamine transferase [Lentisphaerota bacterium WC36G]|nr:UDP-N-acetylglucosamine--N-acetylmuramyl-(pentapeptide) pyrophosphoryl-undecaprenol N-acetylglucosamine transferase [Lentisphaerae bacterium WC36]